MGKKFDKHSMVILGILVVAIVLFIPMFITPYKENDDTWFHLMNIGLIKNSIQENFWKGFSLKILPFVGNNFGYGTRLFYPPLAHTLGAYLSYFLELVQVPLVDALKIFHFVTFFLAGITMYFCGYRFHKDKFLSFLGSVIYMASCYHISEHYVRDSLGESLLFIFLPLIIISIKELLEGNKKLFYPCFIIGYVGGILAHFTMMIYVTIILGVSMLFFAKKIFQKEFLIPFIKACGVVLLLTLFFFEPMFEHKLFGQYMVYKKWYMSMGIYHTTLWGCEYFIDLPDSPVSFRFSIVTICLLLYVIFKKKKILLQEPYYLVTLFLGISFIMSTRLFFPWLFLPYLFFMIQFGWRLVLLVIFGVSLLAPLALKENKQVFLKTFILGSIILTGLVATINHRNNLDLNKINYAAIMGWQQEYLPEKIGGNEESKKYFEERNEDILVKKGQGVVKILTNRVPYLAFEVKAEELLEVEFPRIFYLGYVLKDSNGEKIPLFESEHGFLSAKIESGSYTLDFCGTKAYNICKWLSIITLVMVILYSFYYIFMRFLRKRKV